MTKFHDREKLFNKQGYILLKDYVVDIFSMKENGPWKLPLGHTDILLLFILKTLLNNKWLSENLFIKYEHVWSPAYNIILNYLSKQGLVDECFENSLRQPGLFSYTLVKNPKENENLKRIHSSGVAKTKFVALSKAIGEALERNISGYKDKTDDIIVSSALSLKESCNIFYPPKFHRFLPKQKKLFQEGENNETKIMEWVTGEDLISKEKVYIPKHITSWLLGSEDEKSIFINPTTNGSALAFNKDEAALRGILEVIQRDAFLVHWLTGIAPLRVNEETLPQYIKNEIGSYKSRGIDLNILSITTNIKVPSVCVIAISSEADLPAVVASASSAFTFDEAIREALREMAICSQLMEDDLSLPDTEIVPFISDLDKWKRPAYWRGTKRVKECSWFISGKSASFGDLNQDNIFQAKDKSDLENLLNVLSKMGSDYYPVMYHPKNEIQESLGFYIAQIFIPKAFPLYLVEKYGTFDSDRLKEFAEYKGVTSWSITESPHMFT